MFTYMLQASFFILSIYTRSALAQGVNHANRHSGWHLGGGPYFCGTDADGDGTEFLAAVMGPQCGATIWIKNTGTYGPSVNNGIGNCITAKLVDQEGGGSVDLNPAAWSALSNAPPGQVSVEWGYGSCGDSDSKPAQGSSSSDSNSDDSSTESESSNGSSDTSSNESSNSDDPSNKSSSDSSSDSSSSKQQAQSTSGDSCSVQANDRCGGKDFNGCTTCADDMECFFFNKGWSDCKPKGFALRVRRGFAEVLKL